MEFLPIDALVSDADEDGELLEPREASLRRGIAARLNLLAVDRFELQYASKAVSRHMSAPRQAHWKAVKRTGHYLVGRPGRMHHRTSTFSQTLTGLAAEKPPRVPVGESSR